MRKLLLAITMIAALKMPVYASAPKVPDSAREFMPSSSENFGAGLMEVLRDMLLSFSPALKEAAAVCIGVTAAVMIVSLVNNMSGTSRKAAALAGAVSVGTILLRASRSMVPLAAGTVTQISEYGKLLLPVMTAALAAQGGVTTSAALYTAAAAFDAFLSSLISKLLIPLVYLFLALSVANSAVGGGLLQKLRDNIKWLMTWGLKTVLYIFTGFIGITGVVSGTTDAAALKAAKLTISGVVPVVGGILSDASEAVLVSAGTVKNAVGIYGMFAVLAIWMGPFLKIGAHYLLLKVTAALCDVFGDRQSVELIRDFSAALGLLLAMTGTVCLMLMISMVCFMKGVA